MNQSHHVDILAPPERVFYWLDDSNRLIAWAGGVVESEDLVVTEERVGSTFRQVYEENGRKMAFQGVVTCYEKNRRLAASLTGEFFDLDVGYVLESHGPGTRLTQTSRVRFKGFMKVVGLLMGTFMRKAGLKKLQEDFARLKALCEEA